MEKGISRRLYVYSLKSHRKITVIRYLVRIKNINKNEHRIVYMLFRWSLFHYIKAVILIERRSITIIRETNAQISNEAGALTIKNYTKAVILIERSALTIKRDTKAEI